MKQEQILESLSKLDPQNKDHWNQDGQPRLGAVGEGVSRNQVLAAAPLFSRENPILPDQEVLTDEEVQKTLEDELLEIDLAREDAEKAIKIANKAKAEAEAAVKAAQDRLEELRQRELSRDTRSDTEINMDYLRGCLRERMEKAGAQQQARILLEQAGLGGQVKSLTASPIDRAIARRVIAERKNKS
jgi:hypothetical protein